MKFYLLLTSVLQFSLLFTGCSENEEIESAVFETISAGDTAGVFIAEEVQTHSSDPDNWTGYVIFSGELELSGRYGGHPAFPDSAVISFFPDRRSVPLLPRYIKDERDGWFTLSNEEDDPVLLALRQPKSGSARILISDFFYIYAPSDVENTAKVLEIIEINEDEVN